jgi:hypothetical protein
MALCDPALPPSTPVGTLLEALNANPNFSRFAAWVRQTPASFGGADFEALADVLSKANSTYALLVRPSSQRIMSAPQAPGHDHTDIASITHNASITQHHNTTGAHQ